MIDVISSEEKKIPIIEIGPGKGSLTKYLLDMPNPVYCIEIDTDLHPLLIDKFSPYSNFTLIKGDIRDYVLPDEFEEIIVVGNVPYYISFEIIDFVIKNRNKVRKAYFTFQKEFAQKLVSGVNSKIYGFLTVYAAMFYSSRVEFKIPASAFSPKPKIDSAFISMSKNVYDLVDYPELKRLKDFLRSIFSQRRKKLSNIIKSKFPLILDDLIDVVDLGARPENISPDVFSKMFSFYVKKY